MNTVPPCTNSRRRATKISKGPSVKDTAIVRVPDNFSTKYFFCVAGTPVTVPRILEGQGKPGARWTSHCLCSSLRQDLLCNLNIFILNQRATQASQRSPTLLAMPPKQPRRPSVLDSIHTLTEKANADKSSAALEHLTSVMMNGFPLLTLLCLWLCPPVEAHLSLERVLSRREAGAGLLLSLRHPTPLLPHPPAGGQRGGEDLSPAGHRGGGGRLRGRGGDQRERRREGRRERRREEEESGVVSPGRLFLLSPDRAGAPLSPLLSLLRHLPAGERGGGEEAGREHRGEGGEAGPGGVPREGPRHSLRGHEEEALSPLLSPGRAPAPAGGRGHERLRQPQQGEDSERDSGV